MKHVSIFRLPILWMFLGPPAFRIASERDGMASVQGDQDIWNILRVIWWLFWGAVAAVELLRSRPRLGGYVRRLGSLPVWVGLWLLAMFASSIVSPSPVFTLANAIMFVMLVIAALDLGLKLHTGAVSSGRVLQIMLFLSVTLLLVAGTAYIFVPERVGLSGYQYTGHRVRGGGIAYTPILSQIVFFLGLYFGLAKRGKASWLSWGVMVFGLWFLIQTQTRVAYVSCILGLFFFAWHWGELKHKFVRLTASLALLGSIICGVSFLYGMSHTVRWELDRAYERFVLRDAYAIENKDLAVQSISTLNGRTEAQAVLLERIVAEPLGLGYIAGVRTYMTRKQQEGELSVPLEGAHNAYLETWAGTGYAGFLGYMAMIFFVLWRARKLRSGSLDVLMMRVLLLVVLFEGLFENEMAFPFHQSPVLFWVLAALITARGVREARVAYSPRLRQPGGHPLAISG